MARTRSRYICRECGNISPKWTGKCSECGSWNSFDEEIVPAKSVDVRRSLASGSPPIPLSAVETTSMKRISTGISELDRVLGGGLVPGSIVLIGGEPGIGKSTLMLQVSHRISENISPALYITGEESLPQIKMRAERLSIRSDMLHVLSETSVDVIGEHIVQMKPSAVVIDSIQTARKTDLDSAPGSVTQIRESAAEFTVIAKSHGIPIFLVGHVTKEGAIAGPKLVEHMVDTVLYFEGDRQHTYRILRATKNRFGSTNEIGIFEMKSEGLIEVDNPSEVFLSEGRREISGTVVVSGIEGTRPILFELQALVVPTNMAMPRRTGTGIDNNRLSLLLAVLEKRIGLKVGNMDVFVNVTGGIRVDEPAADLGLISAVVSSIRDIPIDPRTVIIGEVGLGGEVRGVNQIDRRINEAEKLGFRTVIVPEANVRSIISQTGVEIVPVSNIFRALGVILKS